MAYYADLTSLLELLDELTHPDHPYRNFLVNKQKIASLYEKFSHLLELLKHYSLTDKAVVDCLERRLRNAAYQTQDIIEAQISDQIQRKLHSQSQRCTENQDFERVNKEVDSIVEEMMRFKESHKAHEDLQLDSCSIGVSNQALSGRSTIEGFDEQITKIKDQLCGQSSKLRVVSIVGMGGIGKTTLARNIFDDRLIDEYFYCRAWITLSQNYLLRDILQSFLDSLTINQKDLREELSEVGESELMEHIYKCLKGKRYLIIIDDIWDTNIWDDIKMILPDDSNGSRVIITTRLFDVAFYADSGGFIHRMQFLDKDQSWNLFREKVVCPPKLEDIGRLVAKNCRGLPLAITVIAGLLSKVNKTRYAWQQIARNVSSTAVLNDEHFSNILSLSYNHLPHYLRACFLYIGGFPEDHEIPVSKLIKLWVAEGIVQPKESKSLEEVAEEYLEDLVNRNLILITKKKSNGKFRCCSIHDLLRSLCAENVQYENFLHVLDKNSDSYLQTKNSARRLCIDAHSHFSRATKCGPHVRSVLFFRDIWNFSSFASGFRLLRVLDALKVTFFSFPTAIIQLFHLRYLSLKILSLPIPPLISKLRNLQTLIFDGNSLLPSDIWKMPHLRHVMISRMSLSPIPFAFAETIDLGEFPKLQGLQTLSSVVNFKFTTDTVEMIPNLKKLKICYTDERREKWQEFCLDNLVHLSKLETLDIRFSLSRSYMKVEPLPESFAFPLNLKKLTLKGCRLHWKDLTTVGSLPNLQVLKLRFDSFVGEEWEPIEGEFIRLKFLLMEELYHLKHWRADRIHFPCLEHLKIIKCIKLEEIPLGMGEIPTLEIIQVYYSNLAGDSALGIQEEQRDLGNDVLHVRVLR